jgi:O-antigen/teichoic acid export membrane protein
LLAGASIVNSRLDTLMLGFLAPNAQVAFYRVAAAAAIFASFALQAANVALGPRVSTLYSKGAIDELNELLRSTGRRVFLFSVGVALIGVVLGSPAISFLYGEDFLPAYQPLLVLFVGYVMSAFAGPVNTVLAMTGNQNRALFALLIGGGTNVGLNFLLIPTYGALGAAFASAISFLIWNALMLILLVRNTGIRTIPIGGKNVN